MLSVLTGREVPEPVVSPAFQQHGLSCYLLPWRPGTAVSVLVPLYSGPSAHPLLRDMFIPTEVSLRPF